jgi:response regulator of citrate/malate metabolism
MNILIVEDDPMVGQINRKFALKIPFVMDCDIVVNPEEARERLRKRDYDLLLLDVYFPTGRGPDLLQWIRNEKIPVHVIFITADNSQDTVERATHLGALDYLTKPFTFERFRTALEEAEKKIRSINSTVEFNQEYLDRIFQSHFESPGVQMRELDKGMSDKTYEIVKKELSKMERSFTAEQLGKKLGIARVTIRRYLDYMEKQDILDVTLQYGKVGRPQHYYRMKRKK